MIPVVILALWALSHPLAGAVALAVVVGSVLGARRAWRLVRCFRDCGGFAVDLAGTVRITIARVHADAPS